MMEELKESSYDPMVVCRASIGCLMSYRLKVDHQDVNDNDFHYDPDDADIANYADHQRRRITSPFVFFLLALHWPS